MAINRLHLATPPARDNELELPTARSETEATVNRAFAPLAQAIKDLQQDVRSLRQEFQDLRVEMTEREARWDRRLRVFALAIVGADIAAVSAGVGIVLAFN